MSGTTSSCPLPPIEVSVAGIETVAASALGPARRESSGASGACNGVRHVYRTLLGIAPAVAIYSDFPGL